MTQSTNFFPEGYSIPNMNSGYMKFENGKNKFRILDRPIFGWVWWVKNGETKTAHRAPYDEGRPAGAKELKHFWLMPVWNYDQKKIQILEITQVTVQRAIEAIVNDADWGNPTGFDLSVTRKGTGMDTEYLTMPGKSGAISEEIEAAYEEKREELEEDFENLFNEEEPANDDAATGEEDDEEEEKKEEEEEKEEVVKKVAKPSATPRKKAWQKEAK